MLGDVLLASGPLGTGRGRPDRYGRASRKGAWGAGQAARTVSGWPARRGALRRGLPALLGLGLPQRGPGMGAGRGGDISWGGDTYHVTNTHDDNDNPNDTKTTSYIYTYIHTCVTIVLRYTAGIIYPL